MKSGHYIFYDDKKIRRKIIKIFLLVVLLIFIVFLIGLVLGALSHPQLKEVNKKDPVIGDKNPVMEEPAQWTPKEEDLQKLLAQKKFLPDSRQLISKNNQVMAFFDNYSANSMVSLKNNADKLDILLPVWLNLELEQGDIKITDTPTRKDVVDYLFKKNLHPKIIPVANNLDANLSWNKTALQGMIQNSQYRKKNIQNLLNYVEANNFSGICLNYQGFEENQNDYKNYLNELSSTFHQKGLYVYQNISLYNNYDQKMFENIDSVIISAYDQYYLPQKPGPLASEVWLTNALEKYYATYPPEKIVLSFGNYGYDWQDNNQEVKLITHDEIVNLLKKSGNKIAYDANSLNPHFDYYDVSDNLHSVWFLDSTTAYNQILAAHKFGIFNLALWSLGTEDVSLWNFYHKNLILAQNSPNSLKILPESQKIIYWGDGPILKLSNLPEAGQRLININSEELIVYEEFIKYNSGYTIERLGKKLGYKKIVLTFDDGPDKIYTPKILNILKNFNIPATFFVIGLNALSNENIIKDIISSGNEIGLHTFSHPDTESISSEDLTIELNATQSVIQSQINIQSVIYRPPYAQNLEPNPPEDMEVLDLPSNLGYYTVTSGIDPRDWEKLQAKQIVDRVLSEVKKDQKNIILLHDGGGNRSETVKALPIIIETLKNEGYDFVSISDLLGVDRSDLMQIKEDNLQNNFVSYCLRIISHLGPIIRTVFYFGLAIGFIKFISIMILAFINRHIGRKNIDDYLPSVSVVVPAYNEEKVIVKTIKSILRSNYPKLKVFVVDDGSVDRTFGVLKENFFNVKNVKIFREKNHGKAESLNHAINKTISEIIITMDADTLIKPDAITKLVRHFINPKVGAVAGNAKVGNNKNILTCMQTIEYITAQSLDRRAFDVVNSITVVPGAIGAWRREAVIKNHGFQNDTLAEDADLTLSLLKQGYSIKYEPRAIALTEVPETLGDFLRQRFRWSLGTLQVGWKYRNTLFRKKYTNLGFLAVPNILIFQILFSILALIMDLIFIVTIMFAVFQYKQHPLEYSWSNLINLSLYYGLFILLDFLTTLFAFLIDKKNNKRLLFLVFLQRFFYRQLIYYTCWKALIIAINGNLVGWEKIIRKNSVSTELSNE